MAGTILQYALTVIATLAFIFLIGLVYGFGLREGEKRAAEKYQERIASARGARGFERPMPFSHTTTANVRVADFRNKPQEFDQNDK